jgi:hypothetical protein
MVVDEQLALATDNKRFLGMQHAGTGCSETKT